MKFSILNLLGFIAFLVTLALVAGGVWYFLDGNSGFGGLQGKTGRFFQEETGEEIFDSPVTRFSVSNVAGKIEIEVWDNPALKVEYRKEGLTDQSLERIQINMTKKGDSVEVRTEHRGASSGWVSYKIFVPRELTEIKARSVSGSIRVEEPADLSGSLLKIAQELRTTSGSISTAGAEDLAMNSVSGSLAFRSSGRTIRTETVSGRIEGEISDLSPSQRIEMQSVSGSIGIKLPASWGGNLELGSVSGSLNSRVPFIMQEQSRNRLKGTLGEGNAFLGAKTTSGSITVE